MAEEEKKDPKAEEAKKRKAFLRQERAKRNIQQCVLGENLEKVLDFFRGEGQREVFNYRTFRQVSGAPPQIVTALRGTSDLECFYNIKTSTLSLLQPKIRLFKVRYTKKDLQGQIIELQEPVMNEIKFADNFGKQESINVTNYLRSETSSPNWRNVGFRSFSLQYFGRDHGAVERNIRCELSLNFKGLKDLKAMPPGQNDIRYVDLVLYPEAKINRQTQKYNPKHYEIRALVGYEIPSDASLKAAGVTDPAELKCIRKIKNTNLMVALSLHKHSFDIQDDGSVNLNAQYFGRIETALRSSHANVFQPSLRRASNGDVSFAAHADPEATPANLGRMKITIREAHKDLRSADDKNNGEALVKQLLASPAFVHMYEEYSGHQIKDRTGFISPRGEELVKQTLHSPTEATFLLKKIDSVAGVLRSEAYRSFMSQIIAGAPTGVGTGTRLFCASVPAEMMEKAMGLASTLAAGSKKTADDVEEELKLKEKEKIKKQTSLAIGEMGEANFIVGRCSKVAASVERLATLTKNAAAFTETPDSESSSQDGDAPPDEEDLNRRSLLTGYRDGDSYQFHFVFVGDIIELACKNAGIVSLHEDGKHVYTPASYFKQEAENSADYFLSRLRILLGPAEYRSSTGQLKSCNLAELPISFDIFREWFTNTIIRKDQTTLPLGRFLRMFVNEVVLPSLGADCIRPIKPRGSVAESIQVTLPGRSSDGGTYAELLPTTERKIDINDGFFRVAYEKKVASSGRTDSSVRSSYDYLLLQMSSLSDISRRSGQTLTDLKDGIYHFNIGSDRGLLKTMRFTKDDIPGLAEARSLQALEGGGDQLAQLAFPYNVDLNLVGNTLFTPGMIVYANPTFLGLGNADDRNSLAYQLNLGGYFLILETEIIIEPGNFETRITKARTLGQGNDPKKQKRGLVQ